ncbi:MAG: hypothetical protein WDN48_18485 [Pseudolabrys sp.]
MTLTALNRRSDDATANAAAARERAEAAEKAVNELRSSVQIAATASAGLSSADLDALQKRIAALEASRQGFGYRYAARLALSARRCATPPIAAYRSLPRWRRPKRSAPTTKSWRRSNSSRLPACRHKPRWRRNCARCCRA